MNDNECIVRLRHAAPAQTMNFVVEMSRARTARVPIGSRGRRYALSMPVIESIPLYFLLSRVMLARILRERESKYDDR